MSNKNLSVVDLAELSGLTPNTLRRYAKGFSDLVRGEDFYVVRKLYNRRRLYFTPRGIYRVTTRSYRTFQRPHQRHRIALENGGLPRRYEGQSTGELNQRLRNRADLMLIRYPDSPCALPNCPCIVHKLGLAQADEYARLAELRKQAKEKRREREG